MKNIYLFYGSNKEALIDFQNSIAKKFLKKELDDFTYIKLNMMHSTIEELLYECQSSGFFSSKKVVVAENATFLEVKPKKSKVNYNMDILQSYIDNPNTETILILKCNDNIDKRKKIVKSISKIGEVKEFQEFKDKDLEAFVITYLKDNNISIEKDVSRFLIIYSNQDFAGLKKELEKLVLYVDDKKIVTKEDIEMLVTRSLDYDIFELTNSLFSKKYITLREVFLSLKLKGEEPVYLLGLIASQLRLYYKVKVLLNEHYSQKDIASKLNVHPYRIQLAVSSVYNYSLEQLMTSLIICCDIDEKLKNQNIDKYLLLDILINKLIEKLK